MNADDYALLRSTADARPVALAERNAALYEALVRINLAVGLPPNALPERTEARVRRLRFMVEGT